MKNAYSATYETDQVTLEGTRRDLKGALIYQEVVKIVQAAVTVVASENIELLLQHNADVAEP